MSATNRGAVRVVGDYYPTPDWCVKAIAKKISWCEVRTVGEPCVGDGAILRNIPKLQFFTTDIAEGTDYLKYGLPKVDLILTNPPYNFAREFLERSLIEARCVVYLLRINFLGSAKRKELFQKHQPTHLYVLSERPSFVDVCAGFTKTATTPKIPGCGAAYQKVAEVKVCHDCGGHVKAGTDATEYAWFAWDMDGIMEEDPGIYVL